MGKFGKRLRDLRTTAGMKQSELADKLEVSVQSLSAYENGREPNYNVLCRISFVFDVSIDYLLGMDSYKNPKDSNLANKLSNGRAKELPYILQKNAYTIYSQLLECLFLNQQMYERVCANEEGYPAKLNSDLINVLGETIEAYKMIAIYLEDKSSFYSTVYKFNEMLSEIKSPFKSIENIASYYKISDQPCIGESAQEGINDGQHHKADK